MDLIEYYNDSHTIKIGSIVEYYNPLYEHTFECVVNRINLLGCNGDPSYLIETTGPINNNFYFVRCVYRNELTLVRR